MRKKNFKFKIFKLMKFTFKTRFSQLLLRIAFDDRFWRSNIDILYLSTVAYKQLRPEIILKIENNFFWKLWIQKNEIRIN